MAIDWTKPIQFENGERCELLSIHPDGSPNFPDKTHVILRPDEKVAQAAVWWVNEDGKSNWPGYNIINSPI